MFHLDSSQNGVGTSLVDEVDLAPAFLVDRFGQPLPGDGSRCTGRYTFVGDDGSLFTVYEYKSTTAYLDDEEGALVPEEFWRSAQEHEFSVGGFGAYGDGSSHAFIKWLARQYQDWKFTR